MKKVVINQQLSKVTTGEITQLSQYMVDKDAASFSDIRTNIPGFETWTDGELHELAIKAGFRVQSVGG